MSKNNYYWKALQFHDAFEQPIAESPQPLYKGEREAAADNFLKITATRLEQVMNTMKEAQTYQGARVTKRGSWMLEELIEFLRADTVVDQADALTDLLYFVMGTFVEMGIKPDALFDIVHNANMAKLVNGKPMRDKQGKIIKPTGWKEKHTPEPLIAAEIAKQREEAG